MSIEFSAATHVIGDDDDGGVAVNGTLVTAAAAGPSSMRDVNGRTGVSSVPGMLVGPDEAESQCTSRQPV